MLKIGHESASTMGRWRLFAQGLVVWLEEDKQPRTISPSSIVKKVKVIDSGAVGRMGKLLWGVTKV